MSRESERNMGTLTLRRLIASRSSKDIKTYHLLSSSLNKILTPE